MRETRFYHRRSSKLVSLAAGLLTLALAAGPSEAWAKPKHHGTVVRHVYVGPSHFVAPRVVQRTFVVPQVIYQPTVATYRPYYYGQVYYPAGGRNVPVYAFPVWVNGVPVYYPYAYDGGRLLSRGYFTASGPHFSFGVGF